jgi:hypothetical protein
MKYPCHWPPGAIMRWHGLVERGANAGVQMTQETRALTPHAQRVSRRWRWLPVEAGADVTIQGA